MATKIDGTQLKPQKFTLGKANELLIFGPATVEVAGPSIVRVFDKNTKVNVDSEARAVIRRVKS